MCDVLLLTSTYALCGDPLCCIIRGKSRILERGGGGGGGGGGSFICRAAAKGSTQR